MISDNKYLLTTDKSGEDHMFQYDSLTEYQLARARHQDAIQRLGRQRLLHEAELQNAESVSHPLAGLAATFARLGHAVRRDRSNGAVAAAEAMLRDSQRGTVAAHR